jgi:pyruvate/2-oxoacid:ferredoxin oxidoreductase alpha subunit
MLEQIEGSKAMARAIGLRRPQAVCAYPITPQTHIVEGLGDLARLGRLENCEFINVESEFAALSVAIGASAAGARACAAASSQGLPFMAEAVSQCGQPRFAHRDDARRSGDRRAHQYLERPLRRDVDALRQSSPEQNK